MTVQDKIDTKFLKDTVADVVVKACSACAVARPEDPVGFVAGWLDQFVANDAILKKRAVELTERAAVEAEEEEVRHPEINAHAEHAFTTTSATVSLRNFVSILSWTVMTFPPPTRREFVPTAAERTASAQEKKAKKKGLIIIISV